MLSVSFNSRDGSAVWVPGTTWAKVSGLAGDYLDFSSTRRESPVGRGIRLETIQARVRTGFAVEPLRWRVFRRTVFTGVRLTDQVRIKRGGRIPSDRYVATVVQRNRP